MKTNNISYSLRLIPVYFLVLIITLTCNTTCSLNNYQANIYDFLISIGIRKQPILIKEKKTYGNAANGVFASNDFDGGCLNDFKAINDTLYRSINLSENSLIRLNFCLDKAIGMKA